MRDKSVEVGFEALEGLPVLAAEEFVLEVPEDLFGGAISASYIYTELWDHNDSG